MGFEIGALSMGGISIATIIVQKLKFYVKQNGSLNWGVGCMDSPLQNDDETEVKTVDLGDVHVMYVKNKHHTAPHVEPETEYESVDEHAHVEESCCFKTH